jgi:prepilin-type N-terminal cleavage/methylation domain-containing protein
MHRTKGFTLVELLVAISIIGILIALMIPAVQSAREASRRMQCANNMKQMAAAVQNHNDAMRIFPTAGFIPWETSIIRTMRGKVPATAPGQTWSGMYQILPYMEYKNIWMLPDDNTIIQQVIPTYSCPSRRSPTVSWWIDGGAALVDYAMNGGSNVLEERASSTGPFKEVTEKDRTARRLVDIVDGLSNTLLFGEKYVYFEFYAGESWGDNGSYVRGYYWCNTRWSRHMGIYQDGTMPVVDSMGRIYSASISDPWNFFGSAHPYTMNAAMCDGSVHALKYDISVGVFDQLCNINDANDKEIQRYNLPPLGSWSD